MIKWHYFSRFLKLCLFGFLISFSTVFANSVDSAYYQTIGANYSPSPYYNNYDITILKRWKFLSNYIWQAKPFYSLAEYTFMFRNEWKLYYYDSWNYCSDRYDTIQWYFENYYICNEYTPWATVDNCSNATPYDSEVVWRFLQNVENDDYFYFERNPSWDSYCRTSSNDWTFCFSSHSLWKSICFTFSKPWYQALQWFSWSLDLPAKQWWWIDVSLLWDPPLYQYDSPIVETWNIVEIPPELLTNWDIMNYFENTWNWDWDMCYVWTTDLSSSYNWDYTRLWGYNIFEAYSILYSWTNVSDPKGYVQWTNSMNVWWWINTLYNNYYTYYVKRLDYINYDWNPLHYSFWWSNWLYSIDRNSTYYPFDWRPSIELSLGSKYYNRYLNTDQNWQDIAYYCSAVLSTWWNNEVYDWNLPNYLINNINWQVNNQLNQSTDWQDSEYQVPSWSWFMLTWNENFSTSLKDFYAKLTMKLNTDNTYRTTWVIPDYILWFLVLILLFRFLKK